jgi:uncharacterized protein (DUF608 family)
MINDVLREFLDLGVLAYIDDILIYTKTMEEHVTLLREVLAKLEENHLAVAAHKSIFHAPEVEFLGYMINANGLKMSQRKIDAVLSWEIPCSKRFLGFANYYRRFIKNFSAICRPLTDCLKKTEKVCLDSPLSNSLSHPQTSIHVYSYFKAF